jgi:hypothetical protein
MMSQYCPLDTPTSLRLLKLLPGKYNDDLVGVLEHADLTQLPNYEAVSYVWGAAENPVKFSCNGIKMDITENLAAGLRRLRHIPTVRCLWVDSICIDQKNDKEKSHQVRQMAEIYRSARKVLIWLGEDDTFDEVSTCIQMLKTKVSPQIERLEADQALSTENRRGISRDRPIHEMLDILPLSSPQYGVTLKKLLQNEWFYRAWTYQESFLATSRLFYFGWWICTASDMVAVLRSLDALSYYDYNLQRDLNDISQARVYHMLRGIEFETTKTLGDTTILKNLISHRAARCSLESDLVYSLIGIASHDVAIIPDYSMRFEQVFTDVAVSIIQNMNSLQILGEVDSSREEALVLPSWVPDWRYPKTHARISRLDHRLYSCTGSSKPRLASAALGGNMLCVEGIYWGRIQQQQDKVKFTYDWLMQNNVHMDSYKPTGELMWHACIRTTCADIPNWDKNKETLISRWSGQESDLFHTVSRKGEAAINLDRHSWDVHHTTKFFVTESGYMGRACMNVKEDDVIILLLGGEAPFVLRQDGDNYRFIGEAYVHGIMDGEALIEARRLENPDQEFDDDRSWPSTLHEDGIELPFKTQKFCIV